MGKKTAWVIVGIVFVLVYGWKYAAVTFFGPSDETLIRKALDEAIVASREGRPGGVMDFISDRFQVNSEMPGSRQVANFIKQSHPDITVGKAPPVISGDKATLLAPVEAKITVFGHDIDEKMDHVSLVFQREQGREWLLIPVKKWRLVQVVVPQNLTPSNFEP